VVDEEGPHGNSPFGIDDKGYKTTVVSRLFKTEDWRSEGVEMLRSEAKDSGLYNPVKLTCSAFPLLVWLDRARITM
jgi:hypothetical protein